MLHAYSEDRKTMPLSRRRVAKDELFSSTFHIRRLSRICADTRFAKPRRHNDVLSHGQAFHGPVADDAYVTMRTRIVAHFTMRMGLRNDVCTAGWQGEDQQ